MSALRPSTVLQQWQAKSGLAYAGYCFCILKGEAVSLHPANAPPSSIKCYRRASNALFRSRPSSLEAQHPPLLLCISEMLLSEPSQLHLILVCGVVGCNDHLCVGPVRREKVLERACPPQAKTQVMFTDQDCRHNSRIAKY